MRTRLVVIICIGRENTAQVGLAENNDLVRHSRRSVPIRRSAIPFCQGAPGESFFHCAYGRADRAAIHGLDAGTGRGRQCRGSTTSFVVGSVTELNCTFVPSAGGPTESYMARMRRAGLDIGINQQVAITWGVFAPTRLRRGELAGTYAGSAVSATLGVGLGANALWVDRTTRFPYNRSAFRDKPD
jgi:hypothetical protein